jgi:hypothetical protein
VLKPAPERVTIRKVYAAGLLFLALIPIMSARKTTPLVMSDALIYRIGIAP